jgi:hypothetical protein
MSSRPSIASALVVAIGLWVWPAAAQMDQAITRSQTSNVQRAIQNNLPTPDCRRPAKAQAPDDKSGTTRTTQKDTRRQCE